MGKVVSPNFVWRPAHANNFSRGRVGGRNGQYTFHHVVGTAESAALVFAQASRQASSTFTVTNIPGVIFQHVSMDDTPYTDGNAASNARSITCEHHGDWRFGYRDEVVIQNAALLVAWLRDQGLIDHFYRHRDVSQIATSCSADLPVEEVWGRATDIINAAYGQVAEPTIPARVDIKWTKWDKPQDFVFSRPAKLWRFDQTSWEGFKEGVQEFPQGKRITLLGEGYNPVLNATYYVSEYSLVGKVPNGFNQADLVKAPEPKPVLRWEKLPAPTEYVLKKDADLFNFNFTHWSKLPTVQKFKKGDRVTGVARCYNESTKQWYIVSEYSFASKTPVGWYEIDLDKFTPAPPPVLPVPEWRQKLKSIAPAKFIVSVAQTPIVNLETGDTIKMLGKGTVVDFVKATTVGGTAYLISSYSASLNAPQGIRADDVTVPADPSKDKPSWLTGWEDIANVTMYVRADTDVVDLTTGAAVTALVRGTSVEVGSTTEWFGQRYAITEYSTRLNQGRGIRLDDLDMKPIAEPEPVPAADPEPETTEQKVNFLTEAVRAIKEKLGMK